MLLFIQTAMPSVDTANPEDPERSAYCSLLLSGGFSLLSRSSLAAFTGTVGVLEGVASLLSANHNLESVEVREGSAGVEFLHLDVRRVDSPLLVETEGLSSLGEGRGSGTSEKRKSHLGESESLQRVNNSWEVLQAIDEDSATVDDVNNDDHLAVILAVVDEANSTWFNEIVKTL